MCIKSIVSLEFILTAVWYFCANTREMWGVGVEDHRHTLMKTGYVS